MEDLTKMSRQELLALIEKDKEDERNEDAKNKAEGFPFKVSWWHHPSKGGNDVQKAVYLSIDPTNNLKLSQNVLRQYLKENPKSDMARTILKIKKESKGDFRVINL